MRRRHGLTIPAPHIGFTSVKITTAYLGFDLSACLSGFACILSILSYSADALCDSIIPETFESGRHYLRIAALRTNFARRLTPVPDSQGYMREIGSPSNAGNMM